MIKSIPYVFRMCRKCKNIKFICKFKKHKNCKFGFEYKCKDCYKEYNKKYRNDNKEDILKRERKYKKTHKEDISSYNKKIQEEGYYKNYYHNNKEKYNKYRNDNRDKSKDYHKDYYNNNKEKINQTNKKWREYNPEKVLNYNIKRREKENYQGNGINQEQWLEMMNFFEWKCAYSGKYIGGDNKDRKRTIDHIVPLNNNGEHDVWNCIPMYANYNYSKSDSNMLDWYLEQPFFSMERLTKIYEWRIYAYWKYKK